MHSLVAHLAEASPEIALALRSDPSALLNIADRKLNLEHPSKDEAATPTRGEARNRIPSFPRHARKAASSEPEQAAAEPASGAQGEATERLPSNAGDPELRREVALAQRALAQEPMNARALRILGQLADAANDEPAAAKLIRRRPVTAGECRRLLADARELRAPGLRDSRATCRRAAQNAATSRPAGRTDAGTHCRGQQRQP